jgi:curved DNA-binding protein
LGVQYKDYYKQLGVERHATAADIKKAYRKQARKYHPDMNKANDATERMAEINEAHEVLSNSERREAYDTLGHASAAGAGRTAQATRGDFQKPPGWSDYFHFGEEGEGSEGASAETAHSDFFEELFGRAARSGSGGATAGPRRGRDQHASIALDLQDAYAGAQKTLHLQGLDALTGASTETELQVRIPMGVFAGQTIRLAGHGSAGSGGGAAGDLLLDVQFNPDAQWRTQGRDVYGPLALAPWEAALSPWLVVGTPTGQAEVKIPSGWKAGRTLRLKGRGIPASASASGSAAAKTAGDLYLELMVVLPPADSGAGQEAYAAMAKAFPDFQPRA